VTGEDFSRQAVTLESWSLNWRYITNIQNLDSKKIYA